jgi:hypothetical protein
LSPAKPEFDSRAEAGKNEQAEAVAPMSAQPDHPSVHTKADYVVAQIHTEHLPQVSAYISKVRDGDSASIRVKRGL